MERVRPAIHVFGHIHEARGAIVKEWPDPDEAVAGDDGAAEQRRKRRYTVYVNAAVQPFWKTEPHLVSPSPQTGGRRR